MNRLNVLRSGETAQILNYPEFAEVVASNRQSVRRPTLNGKTLGDWADIGFMWRGYRGVAQYSDNLARAGLFMDRLKSGFTPEAAAEAVETYFYNFNVGGRLQHAVNDWTIFASYPMKTAEFVVEHILKGELGAIQDMTIPHKVKSVLQGYYVESENVRQGLQETLPPYPRIMDPIHGPLVPGGRSVLLDPNWSISAMTSLLDPEKQIDPTLALIYGLFADKPQYDENSPALNEETFKYGVSQFLDATLPQWFGEAAMIMELNGKWKTGGYFTEKYAQDIPSDKQQVVDKVTGLAHPIAEKFNNSVEFAKFMDKNLVEHGGLAGWLYSKAFPERMIGMPKDDKQAYDWVKRSNYVADRFRQLTFGTAVINKLDKTFLLHNAAMNKQVNALKRQIQQREMKTGNLMDPLILDDKARRQAIQGDPDTTQALSEIDALEEKRETLHDHYNFHLMMGEKHPDFDLATLLGLHEVKMDYSLYPKESREKLNFKRQTEKTHEIMGNYREMMLQNIMNEGRVQPPDALPEPEEPTEEPNYPDNEGGEEQ